MKRIVTKVVTALKTDFVKVSAWSSVATVMKMLTSLVSMKVVSTIIGPAGLALVGQFLNSITMIGALATSGVSQGVTKYVAENFDKPTAQRLVINMAIKVVTISTGLVSLITILFAKQFSIYIFKTPQYRSLIIILGITLILYSINTVLIAAINGFKQFKKFIRINIAISLFGLVVTLVLVWVWGLYGALLNCILTQSVTMLVTIFFIAREPWLRAAFTWKKTDWKVVKMLGSFAIMFLLTSIIVPASQMSIRSFISAHLSLDAAGLWEAMNRVSGMYLMVIITSISTFYMPRLSELKQEREIRNEIFKTAKIVLPILIIVCFGIFLFRDLVIKILFTMDFFSMRQLFAAQLFGDFFKVASWLISCLFWAKAMVKYFIITEVIFNITSVLWTMVFVKYYGLEGSAIAYMVNYFVYLLTMIWMFRGLLFKPKADHL